MRRRAPSVLLVAVLLSSSSSGVGAQRRTQAEVGARHSRVVLLEQPGAVVPGRPAAIRPYVLAGSLIGAGATVGAIWISLARSNTECICSPLEFAPVVVGGAVVGALLGVAVYAARRSGRERAATTDVRQGALE